MEYGPKILEELGGVKGELKGVKEHLVTLNGKVADHEGDIGDLKLVDTETKNSVNNMANDLKRAVKHITEKESDDKETQSKWKDRIIMWLLYIGGVLVYTTLLKLEIINI